MIFATPLPFTSQYVLRSIVSEESVMRNRSTLFTGYPKYTQASPTIEVPITTLFTPGQTLAMLAMRKSELSLAVLAKLRQGTAMATREDSHDLMALGYCRLYADGN